MKSLNSNYQIFNPKAFGTNLKSFQQISQIFNPESFQDKSLKSIPEIKSQIIHPDMWFVLIRFNSCLTPNKSYLSEKRCLSSER